jgi:hypothetical protein
MEIAWDKYSLIIDGKREFIKSGSIHYFRVIGENAWRDRLSKMKAGGYNCVDIYLCWNFHTAKKDHWDFEGYKDIEKLFEIARELGLYIIVRPGPFINAEISAGGLPFWLLKDKDIIPRNRKNGDYVYSPKYMEALKDWYAQVLPIINKFQDIVIAFQIENEYSTNGCEDDYIKELYALARTGGITAPIFHNDAYVSGLYADVVDIYACDIYPYIDPKNNWHEDNYAFDTIDNLEDIVRDFKPEAPLFIAEMQAGWYDKWLGWGYDYIREDLNWQHINIMTKTALSQGVTMFNHYMAAGGTNILDMSSDEVYTSYDFAAPISELGLIKENFRKAKEINYFLEGFNLAKTEPVNLDFDVPPECYAKKRHDIINDCNWLFLRNFNTCETQINGVNVQSFDMKILPQNLKFRGCEILSSGLEIFTKIENEKNQWVFIVGDEKNYIHIKDLKTGEIKSYYGYMEDFTTLDFNETKIAFLNYKTLNKTWKLNGGLVFGADFVYAGGKIAMREAKNLKFFDPDKGFYEICIEPKIEPLKLKLTDFNVTFCAPEIERGYDYSDWLDIGDVTDSFSAGVFSEFVWYKGKISNKAGEISINARHIFAIYLNGKEVLNRNSYKYDNMQSVDEYITVGINPEFYDSENSNEITVLVQNLGFDRGFSNDMNEPRGLISFKTDNDEKINWKIRGRISLDKRPYKEGQAPYLAMLSQNFKIPKKLLSDKFYAPIVLDMEHTPFRRATIFLNGVKIGRYIRHNAHQTKFYLPNEFLKENNEIKIVVWEKSHRTTDTWGYKNYLENVIIKVGTFKVYEIFDYHG